MKGEERRNTILTIISSEEKGVSGSTLAKQLGVSRQVIVQDIALLRANGNEIISTTKGYVVNKSNQEERIFKVRHSEDEIQDELEIIVDLGGIIKDVFVYHKSYGIVRAGLNIECRRDIRDYIENLKGGVSTPLMRVTADYHYHTVVAKNKDDLDMIQNELDKKGYLAELRSFEPVDFWSEQ